MPQNTSQSAESDTPNKKPQTSSANQKTKPRFRKPHLILAAVAVALLVAVLLLIFLRPGSQSTAHTDWIDRYYRHLGQIISDTHEYEGNLYLSDIADARVAFYNLEGWESPVMAISYEDKLNDNTARVEFMMIEQGETVFLNDQGSRYFKHFYNMLEGLDDYYVTRSDDTATAACYQSLRAMIRIANEPGGNIEEICTQTTSATDLPGPGIVLESGEELEYSYQPFDRVFLTLPEHDHSFDLTIGMTAEELRQVYDRTIAQLEETTAQSKTELDDIEQRVADAKKRQAAAEQAAQDATKNSTSTTDTATPSPTTSASGSNASAGSNSGIKVGSDLVKYGTYMRLDPNDGVSDWGGRLYLRADGTAAVENNGKKTEYPSYRSEEYGFTQDGYNVTNMPALILYDNQGRQACIMYYRDGILRDTGTTMYKWIGD